MKIAENIEKERKANKRILVELRFDFGMIFSILLGV